MKYNFNADDIFQIAINIEKNGALLYRKAASMESDKAQNR